MRLKIAIVTLVSIFLLNSARAAQSTFLFWYPGGAGNANDAAPLLDLFCGNIAEEIKGLTMKCKYINDEIVGYDYLLKKKPTVAIISYPTWAKYKDKFPDSEVILSTNPLPHGKTTEVYTLVGLKNPDLGTIYSSEPFGDNFIKSIMPKSSGHFKNILTDQMLSTLKKISSGELSGTALLVPMEFETLKTLKGEWAQNLVTIETSIPIPTAKVVLFRTYWKFKNQFEKYLLEASTKSPELMYNLQLKGFSK